MSLEGFARVVEVLAGLTAVGSILATIFGASAILLVVGSTTITIAGAYGVHRSKAMRRRMSLAEQQRTQEQLERMKQQQLQLRKEQTLDSDCADLLRRARVAVEAILASDACTHELIQPPIDRALLRDNVQAISDAGREITDLRNEHNSIIRASSSERTDQGNYLAGPITSAVIRPQRQAIALALVHAKSRIENLERYASTVRTVDITYKDWIGAQKAERLNDRVRDLYARTAADELAVQELNRLAERTAAAERAFHASIREANTVAEILALPDDSSR